MPNSNLSPRSPRPRAIAVAFLTLGGIATAQAQATIQTTPNISTGWIAPKGELLFDLVHRFHIGPAPTHKVLNSSTLALSVGILSTVQVGITYASASEILPESPNEFEFAARTRLLRQATGAPVDVFLHAAYNKTIGSIDGQVNIGHRFGDGRVTVTGTWLSDAFNSGEGRGAIGGGVVVPLGRKMALAGDVTTMLDRADGERVAWSVGFQKAIPQTPHTISINASNVAARTLQGSVAGSHTTRVGFEYTIPITLGARKTAIEGSKASAGPLSGSHFQ